MERCGVRVPPTDEWDGGFLEGIIQILTSTELLFWAGDFCVGQIPHGPPPVSVPPLFPCELQQREQSDLVQCCPP